MSNPLYRLYPVTASMTPPTPPTPTGVLSLNTLTGIVTIVAGTNITVTPSGTNITIDAASSSVSIGTANGLSLAGTVLSLALSSTSTTGALSNTDWNTFNGKQTAGNYITALTGDATASGPGSTALTLATVNSNVGSFGSASSVGVVTVTAKGLVTAAVDTPIVVSESQVTNLTSDLLAKADKTTTISTTAPLAGGGDLSTNRTLSIPAATSSVNGYLSSTDWSTFNNKQAALTPGTISTSTTGITVGSGTSSTVGPNVTVNVQTASTSQPGLLSSTDWNTFNNKQSTLTLGDLTDTGTDGITVTGGTASVVGSGTSIAQHVADASHNGYLSSSDWSTFNGKGSGSVTSVAMTVPAFLSISGSPITTSGTLALTLSGTALPLANGGTGQTTKAAAFDALQPMSAGGDLIYGGASGTGTRLPNGTVGQFLVSGGGTTAPVWTTTVLPTITGPSTLRNFYAMDEDWNTGALAGSYGWTATTATGTVAMNTANLDSTHWGIVALTSGTTSANAALLSLNTALRSTVPGSAVNIYVEVLINLSRLSTAGSDDYTFRVGLMDNWTGLPNNGVWFDYSTLNNATGANWYRSTAVGGIRTQTNSTVAVATGWLKLGIKVTGVTSAEFFVNDVSIGTNSSNMPTNPCWPSIGITKDTHGSTNTTALIDYYSLYAQWPGGR